MPPRTRLVTAIALLALTACARAAPDKPRQRDPDPAVARAIMAPLLADPELAGLAAEHPAPIQLDAALPPEGFAPSTVAAARGEAQRLLAGASPRPLPAAGACPGCAALFLDQRAAVLGPDCRDRLTPSLDWSLRLPPELPIYPKAHLREAAGGDDPACHARAASFTAPVPAHEVLGFYRALAARAGYALQPAGGRAFVGHRGAKRMAVIVRPGENGFAQFDLLAAG